MKCENKGDTLNNEGDWDYFKVIHKIREQHTGKPLCQGNIEIIIIYLTANWLSPGGSGHYACT